MKAYVSCPQGWNNRASCIMNKNVYFRLVIKPENETERNVETIEQKCYVVDLVEHNFAGGFYTPFNTYVHYLSMTVSLYGR